MTQQSHYQTYTLRKPKLKKTHVPQCSLQLYLQQLTWKQTRCPPTHKWIKTLWYVYTMQYYSSIKRNTFESILMRWMNLESIIQSEVNQKEKDKYRILTHLESKRIVLMTLCAGQQRRQRHKEQTSGLSRRRRGWDDLREQH